MLEDFQRGYKEGSKDTKQLAKKELVIRSFAAPIVAFPLIGMLLNVLGLNWYVLFLGAGLTAGLFYLFDKAAESTFKWYQERQERKRQ